MEEPNKTKTIRPVLLTVLCILTIVGASLTMLLALLIPPLADNLVPLINKLPDFSAEEKAQMAVILKAGWGYYLTIFFCSGLSLAGAIFMLHLKKAGFHFYAIAQIIIFYLPIAVLEFPFDPIAALFTASFIGLYALHFNIMN